MWTKVRLKYVSITSTTEGYKKRLPFEQPFSKTDEKKSI